MKFGLVVDVETTGLNPNQDRIIEIGLLEFRMTDGQEPIITGMYSGLEDPERSLSTEVSRLTGLNDDVLKGEKIDWEFVKRIWLRADVVIAHNAEFDRSFLSAHPQLKGTQKHWACSIRHLDWRAKNFGSAKLQYLAADHGFVNPFAHRALFDCATTFRLITPYISELIEASYEPEVEIFAVNSPFESKDVLKVNGYRWDSERRVWRKRIGSKRLQLEREFLSAEIYKGPSRHVEEELHFNAKPNSD